MAINQEYTCPACGIDYDVERYKKGQFLPCPCGVTLLVERVTRWATHDNSSSGQQLEVSIPAQIK